MFPTARTGCSSPKPCGTSDGNRSSISPTDPRTSVTWRSSPGTITANPIMSDPRTTGTATMDRDRGPTACPTAPFSNSLDLISRLSRMVPGDPCLTAICSYTGTDPTSRASQAVTAPTRSERGPTGGRSSTIACSLPASAPAEGRLPSRAGTRDKLPRASDLVLT